MAMSLELGTVLCSQSLRTPFGHSCQGLSYLINEVNNWTHSLVILKTTTFSEILITKQTSILPITSLICMDTHEVK